MAMSALLPELLSGSRTATESWY
ncbi:MAG: hypothetical protein H6R40_473, partial [Gemmatimonadetes bacterium]|nr:hypothetical protein [Gemmatimonadota bacterium]